MERPPRSLLAAAVAYAGMTWAVSGVTLANLLGLVQVTDARGGRMAPPSGWTALLSGAVAGAELCWTAVLLVSLAIAHTGAPRGWWWVRGAWAAGIALVLTEYALGGLLTGLDRPEAEAFFGPTAIDDVCCCLPVQGAWFAVFTLFVGGQWARQLSGRKS